MSWDLLRLFLHGAMFVGVNVVANSFPLRRYVYVNASKQWYEARAYCQQHYTDLALFSSLEEMTALARPEGFSSSYAWIGLLDEPLNWRGHMTQAANGWKWSATGRGSTTGFQIFNVSKEPNYGGARENCIILTFEGKWHDVRCSDHNHFVCFTETSTSPTYTYVSTRLSWSDAVDYCRQHYTDLVMIEDQETNTQIFNMKPAINVWIGLSREAWTWVDGSPLTFSLWEGGAPWNTGRQHCVSEDSMHQWKEAECTNSLPFLCYQLLTLDNFVTLNMHTTADLADPLVNTQILQQLEEVFKAKNYTGFNIKWTIAPKKKTN